VWARGGGVEAKIKFMRHVHPLNRAAEVNNTKVSDLHVRQEEGRGKRGTGNLSFSPFYNHGGYLIISVRLVSYMECLSPETKSLIINTLHSKYF